MSQTCYICEKECTFFIEVPGGRYYSNNEMVAACQDCVNSVTTTKYLHIKNTDKTGAGPYWEPWYVKEYNDGKGNIKIAYHGADEYGRVVKMTGPAKLINNLIDDLTWSQRDPWPVAEKDLHLYQ